MRLVRAAANAHIAASSKSIQKEIGFFRALCRYKRNQRWGKMRLKLNAKTSKGKIIVYESFEVKQYGQSQEPVCYFLKGY